MTFNGQAFLGYQLPELLDTKMVKGIPVTLKQLEQWFSDLPLLNVQQLSSQIPRYIYKINRLPISDVQRFLILERLRPTVDYLYDSIIKKINGRSLYLSKEYREFERLTRELILGMAIGYQRLLFNKAKHKPSFFSRNKYRLLAQRVIYYLGEQVRVSYLFSMAVPKNIWKDLNASYAFSLYFRLNKGNITDQFTYHHSNKGTIENLYYRVLLLAMTSPYSLRNGELEQIYFGLESWLDDITLTKKVDTYSFGYAIEIYSDIGPVYIEELKPEQKYLRVDSSKLLYKLKRWLESDTPPRSAAKKGMSAKLLRHLISNLDSSKRGIRERLDSDGEQVEIIIGLQNIQNFLQHVNAIISSNVVDQISMNNKDEDANNIWGRRLESSWDLDQHYESSAAPSLYKTQNRSGDRIEPSVRRHIFTIVNKSETSVCVSCNSLHGNGLCIGELMIMRADNSESWTLGVVLWMNLSDKQLKAGLFLLSAKADWVTVDKMGTNDDVSIDALWLAGDEQDDTLFLTRAEFKTGDYLTLNYHGEDLSVTLTDTVWHSEGFAQFKFIVGAVE
tara:strand:+ start:362705 stop:364384 length:1680 start_codon:yes stop_codon:yes gene_type:complete